MSGSECENFPDGLRSMADTTRSCAVVTSPVIQLSPFIRVNCFRLRATPAAACLRRRSGFGLEKAAPPGGGAERHGHCLSRMVWAHSGEPRRQGGLGRRPFRGSQVSGGELIPTAFRNLGGPKTGGKALAGGVACAMRERRRQWPGVYADSIAAWGCIRKRSSTE
jgi:hypothetical protein